jgi:CheY-like chemotaxis protein
MPLQIVVVDDDAENGRALSELLAAEGFDPLPFQDGETAWSVLASEQVRPDAVVADVRMPGLGGVALVRRIKARFPDLPVVLVSAFADQAAWDEGLRAGAVDVFPKPIQGASLVSALRDAIGGSLAHGLPSGGNPDPREEGIPSRGRDT